MRWTHRCTRAATFLTVLLLSLPTGACGFIFANGPPSNHNELAYFSCTEGNPGPILDAIGAGLSVVGAAMIAADPDSYESDYGTGAGGGFAVNVAAAALLIPSAVVGFKKTKQCRAAKQELAVRLTKQSNTPTAKTDSIRLTLPRWR